MQTREVEYQAGDILCRGYLAFDEKISGSQPTVLIAPGFDGVTDFAKNFAEKVVAAGYVAFCVDMFGEGQTSTSFEGCMDFIKPLFEDRALLQSRILAGFEAAIAQPEVDSKQVAALGFCFGGLTVLDLARAGADLRGVITFHGSFVPPENVKQGEFKAKVLMLHGYDDPQVTPEQLPMIAKELDDKKVDWQFVYFSDTQHAFMEPKAAEIGKPEFGRVYNETSAKRAWQYAQHFLAEVLIV